MQEGIPTRSVTHRLEVIADLVKGKETLISLLGKEKAKKKSEELIKKSLKILEKFGNKAKNLIDLTNFIISRKK